MSARVTLHAGELDLDLAPAVGGSIAGFRLGDQPLMREAPSGLDDALDAASFPLVPICNRVRDGRFVFRGKVIQLLPNMPGQKHPLHGQGWRNPWTVEASSGSDAELLYRHPPGQWPWAYEAHQRFQLDAGGFDWELECANTSNEDMPCGLGLHPYFPSDPETVVDTAVTTVWTIDEEIMPVDQVPATGRYDLKNRKIDGADLDNGYDGWGGRCEIRWPHRGLGVAFSSKDARRFQLYSPKSGGVVVAEPVTNANDALSRPESQWRDLGIALLAPGERTVLRVRIDVLRDV
jgi:aldose 1-epimerase